MICPLLEESKDKHELKIDLVEIFQGNSPFP
jgi:hypothetical protein